MTRLLIAFSLLFVPISFASAAAASDEPLPCEESLRPGFESWATISEVVGPYSSPFNPKMINYDFYVGLTHFPDSGVGSLKILVEEEILRVKEVSVNPGYKQKGVSTYLFAKVLALFPQVKKVTASLVADNGDVFDGALKETGDQVAAFKATPFYKSFAKLGFSQIDFEKSFVLTTSSGLKARVLTLSRPGEGPPPATDQLAQPKDRFIPFKPKPIL